MKKPDFTQVLRYPSVMLLPGVQFQVLFLVSCEWLRQKVFFLCSLWVTNMQEEENAAFHKGHFPVSYRTCQTFLYCFPALQCLSCQPRMALVRLKRDCWTSRYTEQWASVGPPHDSSLTAEITSEPTRGWSRMELCHQRSHWKPCWCEPGWELWEGRVHLLITSAQRSVNLVTALEASSLMAFVESSLYCLLTNVSTKLPFDTGQSEAVRYSDSGVLGK